MDSWQIWRQALLRVAAATNEMMEKNIIKLFFYEVGFLLDKNVGKVRFICHTEYLYNSFAPYAYRCFCEVRHMLQQQDLGYSIELVGPKEYDFLKKSKQLPERSFLNSISMEVPLDKSFGAPLFLKSNFILMPTAVSYIAFPTGAAYAAACGSAHPYGDVTAAYAYGMANEASVAADSSDHPFDVRCCIEGSSVMSASVSTRPEECANAQDATSYPASAQGQGRDLAEHQQQPQQEASTCAAQDPSVAQVPSCISQDLNQQSEQAQPQLQQPQQSTQPQLQQPQQSTQPQLQQPQQAQTQLPQQQASICTAQDLPELQPQQVASTCTAQDPSVATAQNTASVEQKAANEGDSNYAQMTSYSGYSSVGWNSNDPTSASVMQDSEGGDAESRTEISIGMLSVEEGGCNDFSKEEIFDNLPPLPEGYSDYSPYTDDSDLDENADVYTGDSITIDVNDFEGEAVVGEDEDVKRDFTDENGNDIQFSVSEVERVELRTESDSSISSASHKQVDQDASIPQPVSQSDAFESRVDHAIPQGDAAFPQANASFANGLSPKSIVDRRDLPTAAANGADNAHASNAQNKQAACAMDGTGIGVQEAPTTNPGLLATALDHHHADQTYYDGHDVAMDYNSPATMHGTDPRHNYGDYATCAYEEREYTVDNQQAEFSERNNPCQAFYGSNPYTSMRQSEDQSLRDVVATDVSVEPRSQQPNYAIPQEQLPQQSYAQPQQPQAQAQQSYAQQQQPQAQAQQSYAQQQQPQPQAQQSYAQQMQPQAQQPRAQQQNFAQQQNVADQQHNYVQQHYAPQEPQNYAQQPRVQQQTSQAPVAMPASHFYEQQQHAVQQPMQQVQQQVQQQQYAQMHQPLPSQAYGQQMQHQQHQMPHDQYAAMQQPQQMFHNGHFAAMQSQQQMMQPPMQPQMQPAPAMQYQPNAYAIPDRVDPNKSVNDMTPEELYCYYHEAKPIRYDANGNEIIEFLPEVDLPNQQQKQRKKSARRPMEPDEPIIGPIVKIHEELTFANFVYDTSNVEVVRTAKKISAHPGATESNQLYLYGAAGIGKSHLLNAMATEMIHSGLVGRDEIAFIRCKDFVRHYVSMISEMQKNRFSNQQVYYHKTFLEKRVLIFEDVQLLYGALKSTDSFFNIIAAFLDRPGTQLIACSDRPPAQLNDMEFSDQLISRLQGGLCLEVKAPSDACRRAMILRRCQEAHRTLTPEVVEYLVSKLSADVRELNGAMRTLFSQHPDNAIEITIHDAVRCMARFACNNRPELTITDVIEITANEMNVTKADITSARKKKPISIARSLAMTACREVFKDKCSLNDIGRAFNKDHSSVHEAIQRTKVRLLQDNDLQEHYRAMLQAFTKFQV